MIDPFSSAGRRALDPIRRTVDFEGGLVSKEMDAHLDGLPFINDIVDEILSAQLNFSSVLSTDSPYARGKSMARRVFRAFDTGEQDPPFLSKMQVWLNRYGGDGASEAKIAATIGMAIVIRAFEIQDVEFIEKVRQVPRFQLGDAFEGLEDIGRGDIIDSILGDEEIPSYQVNIAHLVTQMAQRCRYENQVYEGATAMYKVLDSLYRAGAIPGKDMP